ncbi:MAG TPA: hypothetical protein PLG59_08205 [bacterium]|nr:hypothetical protein [bacterium]HQO34627.1 hypothetical protein [bacterium]
MAGFRSWDRESHTHARDEEHDRQQEEFIARKSYEIYQKVSRQAEQETETLLSPIASLRTGKLEDPGDIERLNEALAKATSHLRSKQRIQQLLQDGVSDEAMRNSSKMLLEFNSMIVGYQNRLDDFKNKIPEIIQSLEQERKRKGIPGVALLKINSKISQLQQLVPDLQEKIAQAQADRDRLLNDFSEAVREAAIFRIKLSRLLDSLDLALRESRTQSVLICSCCVQMALALHKQPFEFNLDQAGQTYTLSEAQTVREDTERNEWDGVRRVREAQKRLKIMDRILSEKPESVGKGDDAVFL